MADDTTMERTMLPGFILNVLPLIFYVMAITFSCKAATDFCSQPLGMERWIIADDQITASTTYYAPRYSGKEARLNNGRSWCSKTGTTITDQWVKVDLKKPMSITGIKIQGDPVHPPNYLTKFKLDYNYDGGATFYGKIDSTNLVKEFIGANRQFKLKSIPFLTKPFTARYVRLRPLEKDIGADDVCARFELNGCAYVCNAGLGIENGTSLPSGVSLNASSVESGREAMHGRLFGPLSWCANTNSANEYLEIDFGKVVTMSGLAIQGDPLKRNWVKDFYMYYGTDVSSLEVYTEEGSTKLFIGNKDQNTIVVHWFKVRLTARYLRLKPNQCNGKKCLRIEVIGCESEFVGEVGAENRVLEDSRFAANGWNEWVKDRFLPKDGRLNNDYPWGNWKSVSFTWFKVDLGRIMPVNGISTQGDATYGANYFPDYKLQFSLHESGITIVFVKEEGNSSNKVFAGNTNNMGVKFNFLKSNPVSARYLQFIENTKPPGDYCLRIEIYARPQVCSESFGLIVGEPSTYHPAITTSGGVTPSSKSRLNSKQAWCGTGNSAFILYDLGSEKQVNGIAIQGNPLEDKWVKTFKVQYGSSLSSITTYQVSGTDKIFVGCKSRNLIVYNWFSSEITTRYLKVIPVSFKSEACLRLNIYGCPTSGCFKPVGIKSSASIANSLLTSSTSTTENEAYKGRLNTASAWSACQVGSCSPKEVTQSKPWIQLCLGISQMISGLVIQGFGQIEDLAHVSSFTIKYAYTISGRFYDYKIKSTNKTFVALTGRYGSKQIDFPRALAAQCIRFVVQSQSSTSKNVGLRWEVLGCNPVFLRVAVSLPSALYTVARGQSTIITCTGKGQPGLDISFYSNGSPVVISHIHELQTQVITDHNILGSTTRDLKINALGPQISASYTSCKLTNATTGYVRCERIYKCSAGYPGVVSSLDSKSFTVQVTGLIGKPHAPTGLFSRNITKNSVKISWTASVGNDFPVGKYKVSIYRQTDGRSAAPEQNVNSLEATFSGLTSGTVYRIEVSGKSARFSIYSEKKTITFHTSLKDICNIHEPCKNNATCTNQVVGGYKCRCSPGYTGKNCTVNINECKSNPCSGNGKCIDEVNRYKCICGYLFTGQRCENRIDPCEQANCNNGTCISKNTSYSCSCYAGYTGMYCRTDIDECNMKPRGICQNGKCVSGNGTISCSCFAGYSGLRCETDLWPCRSSPCLRGGKCTNELGNGFSCKCRAGYGGTRCEKKSEQCDAKPCKNGGICKHVEQNGQFVFECGCKGGYGGTFCEYYYGDSSLSVLLKLEKSQAFNETAFKLAIANSLNNHCIKFPDNCPRKDVSVKNYARSRRNSPRRYVFQTTNIKITHGYPKTRQDSAVEVQFHVTVPVSFTGHGNFTENAGTQAVFNPDIVKMSLEEKPDLRSYGFRIQSVELVKRKDEKTSKTFFALETSLIVVAIVASLLLISFVIIAVQCWRARRIKSQRAAKENPQRSKGENQAMSLPELPGGKENKYYENGEQEINRSNLQISHYQELQTNTMPHDSDYLYPDVNKEGFYEPLQFNNSRV